MATLTILRRSVITLSCATLLACGGGGGKEGKAGADGSKTEGQLVAKVNDHEISIHQLNAALAPGNPSLPPERQHEAAKATLDRLIDQQIFVEKAIDKKLDRDPRVVQQIEASKQQILARAYAESLAQGTTAASAAEAQAFYDKHPELFAARRVYRMQEFQLLSNPGPAAVKDIMEGSKNLAEVARKLAAAKIGFNETTVTVLPEQVPMALANELSRMKPGGMLVIPQQNGSVGIAQLLAAQDAPVPAERALPSVEKFLTRQRQGEAVANELKALKEKAKISYLGEFDPKQASLPKPAAAPQAASGTLVVDPAAIGKDSGTSGTLTVDPGSLGKGSQGAITVDSQNLRTGQGGALTAPADGKLKK